MVLWQGLQQGLARLRQTACGAFGLTFVSDFLLKYQTIINVIGGSLVLAMGVRLIFGKKEQVVREEDGGEIKMFLSAFLEGITNPAAVLTFLLAFLYFGITGKTAVFDGIQLVSGIFIRTCIWWWCLLSAAVVFVKKKNKKRSFQYMNRIFGSVLAVLGITVFIKTFL